LPQRRQFNLSGYPGPNGGFYCSHYNYKLVISTRGGDGDSSSLHHFLPDVKNFIKLVTTVAAFQRCKKCTS
jgi:hypothetical protein